MEENKAFQFSSVQQFFSVGILERTKTVLIEWLFYKSSASERNEVWAAGQNSSIYTELIIIAGVWECGETDIARKNIETKICLIYQGQGL